MKTNEHVLVDCYGPFPSNKTSGQCWNLDWVNVETAQYGRTCVDTSMGNFQLWSHVIKSQNPYGVYQGLQPLPRTTQGLKQVLTADQAPRCIHQLTGRAQAQELDDLIQNPPPEIFNSLFE
jgi:hypothetical protein